MRTNIKTKAILLATANARKTAALFLRIARAFRNEDIDSFLEHIVRLVEECVRFGILTATGLAFIAGFWKPHCFILAGLLLFCAAVITQNIFKTTKMKSQLMAEYAEYRKRLRKQRIISAGRVEDLDISDEKIVGEIPIYLSRKHI